MTRRIRLSRLALLGAGLFAVVAMAAAQAVRVRLAPNVSASWRLETTRVDEGDGPGAVDVGGGKKEVRRTEATPLRLTISSASGAAVLESGPIETRGRKIGRVKRSNLTITASGQLAGDAGRRPFAPLMLVLPNQPLKPGAQWTATLWAPAPAPGGVPARYTVRSIKNVGGQRVAEVAMAVRQMQGTRVFGSGTYVVRLSDGFVDSASVRLTIEFIRAASATDRTVSVSSRHRLSSTLRRTN